MCSCEDISEFHQRFQTVYLYFLHGNLSDETCRNGESVLEAQLLRVCTSFFSCVGHRNKLYQLFIDKGHLV